MVRSQFWHKLASFWLFATRVCVYSSTFCPLPTFWPIHTPSYAVIPPSSVSIPFSAESNASFIRFTSFSGLSQPPIVSISPIFYSPKTCFKAASFPQLSLQLSP